MSWTVGPPIRPPKVEPEPHWIQYKPGFVRHSITGKIATGIPSEHSPTPKPFG